MMVSKGDMPIRVSSLTEIVDKYDAFLVDVWGVIHNGIKLYDGVISTFDYLVKNGKQIIIFSNNPYPPEQLRSDLLSKGLYHVENDDLFICNSGGVLIEEIATTEKECFDGKAYVIGEFKFADGLYGEIEYTDDIREASYILMLLNASNKDALDYYDLHGVSIPVVCVNPDVTCMHGDAIRYTAGYFAKQYSDRHGCEVYYYGKPYDNIYNMAFRKARAPKDRILAIGDTIETDILGANNNGVDSMLVLSGILNGKERKEKYSTALPKYIIDSLRV